MSLLAVLGGKGSPGVTSTALLLAALWPRPACLTECDPAGGDLLLWLPAPDGSALRTDIGVVSLLATARGSDPILTEHLQELAGGVPVLAGVSSARQHTALAPAWPSLVGCLRGTGLDVIADCGRFDGQPETGLLLAAADLLVLVCRPTAASVAHTRSTLRAVQAGASAGRRPRRVVVVVLGEPAQARDVRDALSFTGGTEAAGEVTPPLVEALADDLTAARGLAGAWTRRLDRSRLVVSGRLLARRLHEQLPPPPLMVPSAVAEQSAAAAHTDPSIDAPPSLAQIEQADPASSGAVGPVGVTW